MGRAVAVVAGERNGAATSKQRRRRPGRIRRIAAGGLKACSITVFLGVLALLAAYIRVNQGPISLAFLATPIENSINRELSGLSIRVGDVVVRRSDSGPGLEFRLANLRLLDAADELVAVAPLAAINLSVAALMSARIAPSRVDLIRPRMLLLYSESGGLMLSFARPGDVTSAAPAQAPPAPVPAAPLGGEQPAAPGEPDAAQRAFRRVDIAETLADAVQRARRGDGASSYLTEFGLREAVVAFDTGGKQSVWRIPDFSIDLHHRQKRSVISGVASIAGEESPWQLRFRAEDAEKSQSLRLSAQVKDLVPSGLAANLPFKGLLKALQLPVAGEATAELTRNGEVVGAELRLELAKGRLMLPASRLAPLELEQGRLRLRYRRGEQRIEVLPSTFVWGRNHVTLSGGFVPGLGESGEVAWDFTLEAAAGSLIALSPDAGELAVEEFRISGQINPTKGRVLIERVALRAGGAAVSASGEISGLPDDPKLSLEGHLGELSLATLKNVWPAWVAPKSREWVRKSVTRAQLMGAAFKLRSKDAPPHGQPVGAPRRASDLLWSAFTAQATDVAFGYVKGLPPMEAPRVAITLAGDRLEVVIPDGSLTLPSQRKLMLKPSRLLIEDVVPDIPRGEVSLAVQGPAAGVLELADLEPLALLSSSGIVLEGVRGRAEGQLTLALPLTEKLTLADVRAEGKARFTDAAVKDVLGAIDLSGGSIAFDLTPTAIEAKGDVLLNGVSAKLAWQRVFGAPEEQQPRMRLNARLGAADLNQLGLSVGHIVDGEMPVELSVARNATGALVPHLRADLTNTEIILENVAWRKPPGIPAVLEFDIGKGTRHKTELQNVKIHGDNKIAIDGWMALGPDNTLRAFYFPEFSLDIVTRLHLEGNLRADGVWDVKAKGNTYDGHQLFRSLFSLGKLSERQVSPKQQAGIDLKAEIGTMIGFSDTVLHNLRVDLKKRDGKIVALDARGEFAGGAPAAVAIRQDSGKSRVMLAESRDAGAAFRLVGFYPNMRGGEAAIEVNLDGQGHAEKTGTLYVRNFTVLGDPVVSQVLINAPDQGGQQQSGRKVVREQFAFEQMKLPFSVGHGQFVLGESFINGPIVGATMHGKVDMARHTINVAGTYVPAYALNNLLSGLLGPLGGLRPGEGLFGITFAVKGPLGDPQVIVNPLSLVAPGIFRGLFEMSPGKQKITPRGAPVPQRRSGDGASAKASASEPMQGPAEAEAAAAVRTPQVLPAAPARAPAARPLPASPPVPGAAAPAAPAAATAVAPKAKAPATVKAAAKDGKETAKDGKETAKVGKAAAKDGKEAAKEPAAAKDAKKRPEAASSWSTETMMPR